MLCWQNCCCFNYYTFSLPSHPDTKVWKLCSLILNLINNALPSFTTFRLTCSRCPVTIISPRNNLHVILTFTYDPFPSCFTISNAAVIITISFAGNGNPFQNLEKTSVLQEARTFNETPVNAKKCIHILTKILYLLNQVSYDRDLNKISKNWIFWKLDSRDRP